MREAIAFAAQRAHLFTGSLRDNLALARALLKDAPFLLLDEPTAHLDAPTEREAMREIVRAGEGRATLLVTHRLVGLEAFDEVLFSTVAAWSSGGAPSGSPSRRDDVGNR